jgi:ABC-type uncharacterized transport system substrate-binding protein
VRRIGYLREGVAWVPEPLVQSMARLGWIENQNFRFEPRYADDADRLPQLARELAQSKVDLIITAGTGAARAAKQATSVIPVVFSTGGDPVARALVTSMFRPGGNLTGFALGIYDEKQLQMIKAALPAITRVAYPVFPGASEYLKSSPFPEVEVLHIAVQSAEDFNSFFSSALQAGADGALVPDVARLVPHLQDIGMQASKSPLPAIGFQRIFAESGGLLSYGPVLSESYRRMAVQIDKILHGANPANMPVEQPTRFELVINLREAERLHVSIHRSVLLAADELIR